MCNCTKAHMHVQLLGHILCTCSAVVQSKQQIAYTAAGSVPSSLLLPSFESCHGPEYLNVRFARDSSSPCSMLSVSTSGPALAFTTSSHIPPSTMMWSPTCTKKSDRNTSKQRCIHQYICALKRNIQHIRSSSGFHHQLAHTTTSNDVVINLCLIRMQPTDIHAICISHAVDGCWDHSKQYT